MAYSYTLLWYTLLPGKPGLRRAPLRVEAPQAPLTHAVPTPNHCPSPVGSRRGTGCDKAYGYTTSEVPSGWEHDTPMMVDGMPTCASLSRWPVHHIMDHGAEKLNVGT